ncbi:voltage-dependent N-type calcium channel subunit alpha-1B-like, partial [Eumetopias jubatus]|uniref:voltage-dependent N-type calcium channel subunit alpha-1B-like n=1 Tax=Eumetopias jubatus TaxID=34886 RepID=UPI001017207F
VPISAQGRSPMALAQQSHHTQPPLRVLPARPAASLFLASSLSPRDTEANSSLGPAGRDGQHLVQRALGERTVCQPTSHPQPAPNASPKKCSVSTLAPQRPHVAHLCSAALDCAPASQALLHHHHRCHRRRDRKQKSLEKGPSLSADTDGTPSSAAGPGPPPQEGPTGCRTERRQERGRSQERRQPSSSSSEKQCFYSCDRFGGREPSQPKPSLSSHPTSPTAGQEPGPPRPGGGSVNGSPLLSTSGASTPGRGGRRQLPQTSLTPLPSVTYKMANLRLSTLLGYRPASPPFPQAGLAVAFPNTTLCSRETPSASPWPPALGSALTLTWGSVWTVRTLPAPSLRTRLPSRRLWPPTQAAPPGLPMCPP